MTSSIASVVLTLASLAAGSGSMGEPTQPVRLDVVESGDKVLIKVVGASDVPVDAAFKLHVTSEGRGGTNRTTQSGRSRLVPGQEVTMVSLSVSTEAMGQWHATLDVERDGAPAYTVERGSAH